MFRTDLRGQWTLKGKKINCPAQIPGDFHSALIENKIIEDPYYGFNEKELLHLGQEDWTIERDFEYKKIAEAHSILELSQADTYFTVYINNKEAGRGQNQFARHRFDITSLLKDGLNTIKIHFDSAEKRASEEAKKLPYPIPYMKYDIYSPYRNLSRKCQCHGGWDWGPCLMVSGIYGDIFIDQLSDGIFDYVMVNYQEEKKNLWKADLTIKYHSYIADQKNFRFTITGSDIRSVKLEKSFKLNKGDNILKLSIPVENPYIWKTNGELKEEGLSENLIYQLEICLDDFAAKEVKIQKNICFNSLKAVSEKDQIDGQEGRSLYFENRGRKIFAKGSNWIPADSLPSRMTEERYKDLLQSAADANHNCIRVWGGGIYENEIFYDLCDRLGLIVWQDCMFACSLYPSTKDFMNLVEEELEYQIPRLQSHPSIGLWCGNNENYGALDWFAESRENRDTYIIDYDRLYTGLIGRKIKEIDPNRLYWTSSPCAGPEEFADNWHADTKGDMHYWSVWHEKKDKEAYMSIKPRFVSEFGYESFPSIECIKSFAPKDQWNFTSPLMEYHQRSPSGNSIMLENFSRYFRFPKDFENMIYLSQVQQALALRTAVDWWRSLRGRCMGALYWQLNDVWPGPSWSSLEYNGKWKLLHYMTKNFFRNEYLALFVKDGQIFANFINDRAENIKIDLSLYFINFDGSQHSKPVKKSFTAKKESVSSVYKAEISEKDKSQYFIYASYSWTNKNGKKEVHNTECFLCHPKYCNLENPQIEFKSSQIKDAIEIKIKAAKPAFYLSLDAENIRGKFSQNMISLLPDQQVSIYFYPEDNSSAADFDLAFKIKDLYHSY